jgi:hypothetical protein
VDLRFLPLPASLPLSRTLARALSETRFYRNESICGGGMRSLSSGPNEDGTA